MNAYVFIPRKVIDDSLAVSAEPGKRLLEPLKAFALAHELPIQILEDTQIDNEAEVHRHEGDLWICLDGEAEFQEP